MATTPQEEGNYLPIDFENLEYAEDNDIYQVLDPYSNERFLSKSMRDFKNESDVYSWYSRMKFYDPIVLEALIDLGELLETDSALGESLVFENRLIPDETAREVLKKSVLQVAKETYTDFKSHIQRKESETEPEAEAKLETETKTEVVPESLRNMMNDVMGFSLDFKGGIHIEKPEWIAMIEQKPEYKDSLSELNSMFARYMNFTGHIRLQSYPKIRLSSNRMTHDEPLHELYKEYKKVYGKQRREILQKSQLPLMTLEGKDFVIPTESENALKSEDLVKYGLREFFRFIPGRMNYLMIQPYIQKTDAPDTKLGVRLL
jgi:hypothetical protein